MSRRKQRSAFDQVSEFGRGRIVVYRDCGLPFRKIGSRVVTCSAQPQLCKGTGINSCCEELIDEMKALEGQYAQKRGKIILLFDMPEPLQWYHCLLINALQSLPSPHPPVVPSTISWRLAEARLRSQCPLRRFPLTPKHRQSLSSLNSIVDLCIKEGRRADVRFLFPEGAKLALDTSHPCHDYTLNDDDSQWLTSIGQLELSSSNKGVQHCLKCYPFVDLAA
ncbi:hypothetical protein TNCV_5010871 [Trichonephila clavipes]|nr:hypothetical protein TNCV_5010871 [Trichonephila clavipes]